ESIPALREALKDKDSRVRWRAAEALGNLGDRESIPALREALKDQDWHVREAAAEALVKLGPPSIPALREALKDQHSDVRHAAAKALGNLGDHESIPALREALKDQDWHVRGIAAEVLGKLGDRESIPALREALKDEELSVRNAAAKALGKLGPEAIPALREALKDQDEDVGEAAAEALLHLGEVPKTKRDLVFWSCLTPNGIVFLRGIWPEAKEIMLTFLRDPDLPTACRAAETLIRIGDPDTVPHLVRFLQERGSVEVAEWYLNCGQPALERAAREWAAARGYSVGTWPGGYGGPHWGR
ncbi:MAG TPA: HEAT repeat domain-containing protein, partial [Thermoguttaceae bacterium]|nr:HEAT repeat domain-containing protein [Thermoguttaceae bacterium]